MSARRLSLDQVGDIVWELEDRVRRLETEARRLASFLPDPPKRTATPQPRKETDRT